jgi:hypothetical protein
MRLITLLNHCEHFSGFVYEKARLCLAEYVIGTMLALTRSFGRIDVRLRKGEWESQWAVGTLAPPLWPELAGKSWASSASDISTRLWPGEHRHST